MLKKTVLTVILLFGLLNAKAQENEGIKLNVDTGFLSFSKSKNFGLFLYIEPQLKVKNRLFLGLRIGATINSQTFENADNSSFIIDNKSDNGFFSALPTLTVVGDDKLFLRKHIFRPYIGFGLGVYGLVDDIDIFPIGGRTTPEEAIEIRLSYQPGLLLRTGLQFSKIRFGLEYNFIPRSDIEIDSGQKIGTVDSSYLGLSIGFTF